MKKSQLSIFVIIGLIIIIIFGTLLLLKADKKQTDFDLEKIKAGQGEVNQKFLDAYVEHCVEITTIEAEKRYGLDKKASVGPIALYVSTQLPICLEEFEIFKKQNFNVEYEQPDVTATITNNAMIVDVIFPIKLTKQMLSLNFEKTTYTFPRTVTEKINPKTTTTITSADRTFVIEIPPGTKAYLNGEEVNEVGLKQLDRNFNGLSNSVVAGMMAFNGIPHGVEFSQPVKITKYYEDYDIPPFINENNLKVGYYHSVADFWVGLPTKVDPVNNKLIVYTNHFSAYGTVLNCGGTEDPVTYIYTPTIVKQVCDNKEGENSCDGWLEDTPEGYGELYKSADKIKIDEEFNAIDRENWRDIIYCSEDENTNGIEESKGLGINGCPCGSAECTIENLYDGSYDEDYFGTIKCEAPDAGGSGLSAEQKFIEFDEGSKLSTIALFKCDNREECALDDCPDDCFEEFEINDLETLTDKNIVIAKTYCESNCDGVCIEVGKKSDDEKMSVCYADYLSYKYAMSTSDASADRPEWGLKGRDYYVLQFKNAGDTCIATTGVETSTAVEGELSVGDSSVVTPDSENRISQTVKLTFKKDEPATPAATATETETEPESLTMVISPKCNTDDVCSIRNAIVKKKESQIWFILEVDNSNDEGGGEPDACIKGNAEIHFKGTGFKGNYSLLCDENLASQSSPPGIDYINGKCMQCKEATITNSDKTTQTIYRWEERTNAQECLFFADGYCAASAIGRIYPDTTEGSTGCIECVAGDSPYYGVANKIDSCSCIIGPSSAAETTTTTETTTTETTKQPLAVETNNEPAPTEATP